MLEQWDNLNHHFCRKGSFSTDLSITRCWSMYETYVPLCEILDFKLNGKETINIGTKI